MENTFYNAWKGWHDSVVTILGNRNESLDSESKAAINKRIAAFYDLVVQNMKEGIPLNFGLIEEKIEKEVREALKGYDNNNSDGYSEQLYLYTLKQTTHANAGVRRILEVGCGAGYGLNFLARLDSSSIYTGIDISRESINKANARFSTTPGIQFLEGNAESLPFEERVFDTVINVESSHNYPDLGRFYSEVARVLKPGGHFSQVDLFPKGKLEELERTKSQTHGLKWLQNQDISDQVKAAIIKRMQPGSQFMKHLKRNAPFPLRPFIQANFGAEFAGYRGGLYGLVGKLFLMKDDLYSLTAKSSYLNLRAIKNS